MAQQIGAKIGVDGEAEFKRSLGNVAAEAKALKAEMIALKTATSDEADEQERAKQIAEKLNEQIENQQERVRLLTEKLEASKAATGETSTETSRYREQLANAQTTLNQLLTEQKGMTEATNDFADAEVAAGDAAVTTGNMIKANLISDAIQDGLKTLVRLLKEGVETMIGYATDSAAYADAILTSAQVTGLTTTQLQELGYMAELVDVSVDTITGSMRKLTTTMSQARSGSEREAEAFQRLGVRVTNADGTLRNSTAVFWEIIDALGQMEDSTERDALCMELFGRSAASLNPLIAAGTQRIAALAQEAHDMGYVLDDETLESLGALDDALVRLGNARTVIRNRLGAAMAPGLERIIDKLIELADRVDWETIGDALARAIEALADLAIRFIESGELIETLGRITDFLGGKISFVELLRGPEAQVGYQSNQYVQAAGAAEEVSDAESALRAYARLVALGQALNDSNLDDQAVIANRTAVEAAKKALLDGAYGEEIFKAVDSEAFEEMVEAYGDAAQQIVDSGGPWGADIDAALAAGIDQNAYLIEDAWQRALSGITAPAVAGLNYEASTGFASTGGAVSYGGVSVQIYGAEGQSVSDLYDEFSYRLNREVAEREAVFG